MNKFDVERAERLRAKYTPDWELVKGTMLQKSYVFDDYDSVLDFFQAMKPAQVKLDHFADFAFFYNELLVRITTKDVGGLTELDYKLARQMDKIYPQGDSK